MNKFRFPQTTKEKTNAGLIIGGIVVLLIIICVCVICSSCVLSLVSAYGGDGGDTNISVPTPDPVPTPNPNPNPGGFDPPAPVPCEGLTATFYGGPNYSSDSMALGIGAWEKSDFHEGVYDDVESIKIDAGLKVTTFRDDNQSDERGKYTYTQDTPQTQNKYIESIKIECA